MKNNLNLILKKVIEEKKPQADEMAQVKTLLKEFLGKLEANKKKSRILADIFVGGSIAKGTVIKKERYDVDIFVRFDKKYEEKMLSSLLEKILSKTKAEKIHGSRDYFRVEAKKGVYFEIVPVVKIKNPKEARNITDLSYFHVNYTRKKLKGKRVDEVVLAKAFCHATRCYGAESYVNGFSGYALELLIIHYKTFLNFVKAMAKYSNKDKLIIDIENCYKNKKSVLMDINGAKLESPVILVDPTYKQRNALAALSEETFKKFQKECKDFLKKPSIDFFLQKDVDFSVLATDAEKNKQDWILLEAVTSKQEGDVAGSKLLKFYNHFSENIGKKFEIKASEFEYKDKKRAKFFLAVKSKKEILFNGPEVKDKKNVERFKKAHKKTFIKGKRIYAKESLNQSIADFITSWKTNNWDRMKEMYILDLKILD